METLRLADGTIVAASDGDDDAILMGLSLEAIVQHPNDSTKAIILLLRKMRQAGYRVVKEV